MYITIILPTNTQIKQVKSQNKYCFIKRLLYYIMTPYYDMNRKET